MRRSIPLIFAVLVCIGLCSAAIYAQQPPPLDRDYYILHSNSPRFTGLVDSALAETRLRLIDLLGDSLSYRPHVYIVEDPALFDRLSGGGFPDWGAAAAVPRRRLLAVKSPDAFNLNRSLNELLAHEFAHLAVAEKAGYKAVPRWFDEGLAMYVSMEWSWSDNLAMSRAAVFGQYLPLNEIDRVNSFGASKAHVAYAQSYLAVEYLFDQYGPEAVRDFLDGIADGLGPDRALRVAIGRNLERFESELKIYLHRHYNIVSLFMDTIYFWVALAAVVVIAGISQLKKRREYYRKWEDEEKYQSTDFDYGDPNNPEKIDDEDEPWRS